KLVPVSGDVGEEGLGLSPADRQTLVDNVNVVIHSAATLDFQDNLRPTVSINLLGTRRVMDLCKQIKDLKVHERLYEAPEDAERLISLVGTLSDEALDEMEPKRLYEAPEDAERLISLVGTLSDEALDEMEPKRLYEAPEDAERLISLVGTLSDDALDEMEPKRLYEAPEDAERLISLFGTLSDDALDEMEPKRGTPTAASQGQHRGLHTRGRGGQPTVGRRLERRHRQVSTASTVGRRLLLAKDTIADYIPVDVVVNQLLVAGWNAATDK
ncbi:Fatty acyl reductase, partial [Operophtera brumata]